MQRLPPPSPERRARFRRGGAHALRCLPRRGGVGEPARVVDGKQAAPFARLKPDGAVDYRSILFHEHCWACHRKLVRDGVPFTRCKHCHAHGVTDDVLHGGYAR